MLSALLFTSDSVPLAKIRIDHSLTEKKKKHLIYLASMAENEEGEVWNVVQENNEYYDSLDNIKLATLVEDVDSESGSQNGLQGVDVEDPPMRKN